MFWFHFTVYTHEKFFKKLKKKNTPKAYVRRIRRKIYRTPKELNKFTVTYCSLDNEEDKGIFCREYSIFIKFEN